MRYEPEFLDRIRERVTVSSVASRTVKLRRSGKEWKGLSPFNPERTPSFFVNDEKRFYHCFSSGKHGDVFEFLVETEGLTFPEAVERLAGEAGLELPRYRDGGEAALDAALDAVMTAAAAFYARELEASGGTRARAHLDGRGLGPASRGRFQVGYAPPDGRALTAHLANAGLDESAAVAAGLLVAGRGSTRDLFRDRVTFPVSDARGRVVGFAGRSLDDAQAAKWINTPETRLFRKGKLLYNHHRARGEARRGGTVLCVEGYGDAVAVDAAGMPNVVSSMGTSLTAEQLALLWEMAPEPVLCFDGDAAGRRAAVRAARLALPSLGAGKSLRFALMPDGVDPEDLAKASGARGLARAVTASRPVLDVIWSAEASGLPLTSPEGRAELENRMRAALGGVADLVLRRHLASEVSARVEGLRPTATRPVAPPMPARPRPTRRAAAPAAFDAGVLAEAEAAVAAGGGKAAFQRLRAAMGASAGARADGGGTDADEADEGERPPAPGR